MTTNTKSLVMAQYLNEEIGKRSGLSCVLSFDTDGNPLITVGGVAGSPGALIKVMPISWPLAKDIFGNSANIYTPDRILVGFEAPTVSGPAVVDPNTYASKTAILGPVFLSCAHVDIYERANATFPAVGDLVVAKQVASFDASFKYPLAGQ